MKFEAFHPGILGRHDIIAVDMILYPGLWGLFFSHHSPHNNHPRYAADTSTASVLKFLADVRAGESHVAWEQIKNHTITTHHLDADALLPVWAFLHPEQALEQRELLERLSRCGDFFIYIDDTTAKLNFIIEGLHQRLRGDEFRGERVEEYDLTRACFDWLLPRWGKFMDAPATGVDLWDQPMREMRRDLDYLSRPGSIIELWDEHTSVIVADHEPDKHALNSLARNDLLLHWRTDIPERRLDVRPAIGWYDLPSMPHRPRYELPALALLLNAAECEAGGEAGWNYFTGVESLRSSASRIPLDTFPELIHTWLQESTAESVPAAYREDVRQVFRHWSRHVSYQSHDRFAAVKQLSFEPGAPFGGLHLIHRPDKPAVRLIAAESGARALLCAGTKQAGMPFAVSDDFYWNRHSCEPLLLDVTYEDRGAGSLRVEYDSWDDPYGTTAPVQLTGDGVNHTASFCLTNPRLANSQNGSDFRMVLSPGAALALTSITLRKGAFA
ncbi:MAG TPA: DUF6687 family protein [Armatimonadota bacterium]|nr:DUF6687 family protein [Armatimonadota bacterium]